MSDVAAPAQVRSRLPWVILAIAAPGLLATLVLSGINGSLREDAGFIGIAVVMMLGYCGVGALVASRAPGNPVGWLMMAVGISFLVASFSEEYARFAIVRGGAPLDLLAFWLTTWWYVVFFVSLTLILLLFPDGSPLSRRWRVVVQVEIAAGVVGMLFSMFEPGQLELNIPGAAAPNNPLGVEALLVVEPLGVAAFMIMLLMTILAVVSLVLRYHRSAGTDRQRLRLFTSVVVLSFVLLLAAVATGFTGSEALNELLFIAFVSSIGSRIPAAMGVAILRFRMYDVELVIRKTVRFAFVLVSLAATMAFVLFVLGVPVLSRIAGDATDLEVPYYISGVLTGLLFVPMWRLSRRAADRLVFGGRATPYEVLTEFSQRVGESYATDDVLPRMAAVLGTAVGADRADVWLAAASGRSHAAGWPDEGVPDEPGNDAIPITYQGDELGELSVVMPATDPMNDAKRSLLADLAAQAGPVLRNVRLVEDLRESRRRIVTAQDERARKLERDIHDGVQQQLVAFAVKLRLAEQLLDRDPAKAHEALQALQGDATQTLDDLRDLARGIYPPLLADKGLVAAVEAQARRAIAPIEIRAGDIGRLGRDEEASVYFCVLEALNNVAKYAEAGRVTITLSRMDGRASFSIADDGKGFDVAAASFGTGLQGMRDRLDAVGGELRIESMPDRGTVVSGTVPVSPAS